MKRSGTFMRGRNEAFLTEARPPELHRDTRRKNKGGLSRREDKEKRMEGK